MWPRPFYSVSHMAPQLDVPRMYVAEYTIHGILMFLAIYDGACLPSSDSLGIRIELYMRGTTSFPLYYIDAGPIFVHILPEV